MTRSESLFMDTSSPVAGYNKNKTRAAEQRCFAVGGRTKLALFSFPNVQTERLFYVTRTYFGNRKFSYHSRG